MLRRGLTAIAIGFVFGGMVVLAGGDHKKCPMPLQECIERMSASLKTTGWVGIEYDDTLAANAGYRIVTVVPGSPAETAGLQPGDLLYALNGVPFAKDNSAELARARRGWKPGQLIKYTIKREGVDREIRLTLAPMPADVMARWIGEHMASHAAVERATPK